MLIFSLSLFLSLPSLFALCLSSLSPSALVACLTLTPWLDLTVPLPFHLNSRAWLSPFSYALFIAGYMIGPFILGGFSDSRGRKPAMLLCHAGIVAANQVGAGTDR